MVFNDIKKLDEQYYLPVFGERQPLAFTHGEGAYLFDTRNNKYVDFLGGIAVNALGYSDTGFRMALKTQVDKLIHTSNYFYNEAQAKLAQALCVKTGYGKVFFGNSGAEANECAIKLAKKYAYMKGRDTAKFVALKGSFHGRTLATLSATGQEKFHEPFKPDVYDFNYIDINDADQAQAAIGSDVCAVIVEPIQGESGVYPMDKEYAKLLRHLCDTHGVLLIIDEVQTGMGRTGEFLAQTRLGIKADITTLAKALGNGVPIGACLATDKVAEAFQPGDHGSTFGGNHLACVAGLFVTNRINDAMLRDVRDKGAYTKNMLLSIQAEKPHAIKEVRGEGLMVGAELSYTIQVNAVRKKLMDRGIIVGTAGVNTLRLVPPYVISKKDIDGLFAALNEII